MFEFNLAKKSFMHNPELVLENEAHKILRDIGRFKAWLFQHAVLPGILWPLLVYDIPIITEESLERAISNRACRDA